MKRAIVLLLLVASVARAEPPTRKHLLRHAGVTAAGGLALILAEKVWKNDLAPATCRWCEPLAFDGAMRDALVWKNTDRANALSNDGVIAMSGLAVLYALDSGHERGFAQGADDLLDLAEAGLAAASVGEVIKFTVGRERPFVHFATPGRAHDVDDDVAFFSSHTAISVALVTAAGTLASRRDQRLAPWIWGGGFALAATTGYLRIAADRHWATDVLAGAAVGAACGVLVPKLHEHDLSVVPTASGVALTGTF